ncbi:MAG: HD domain-containing protein [Myxococcales bacterium]|nr:HD domain-containing protein [Myxococcales bacterium]
MRNSPQGADDGRHPRPAPPRRPALRAPPHPELRPRRAGRPPRHPALRRARTLHGLSAPARDLLEYAALLHDVGHAIGGSAHHKHTLYIVQNAELAGFSERAASSSPTSRATTAGPSREPSHPVRAPRQAGPRPRHRALDPAARSPTRSTAATTKRPRDRLLHRARHRPRAHGAQVEPDVEVRAAESKSHHFDAALEPPAHRRGGPARPDAALGRARRLGRPTMTDALWRLARRILFLLAPETAHHVAMASLGACCASQVVRGWARRRLVVRDRRRDQCRRPQAPEPPVSRRRPSTRTPAGSKTSACSASASSRSAL